MKNVRGIDLVAPIIGSHCILVVVAKPLAEELKIRVSTRHIKEPGTFRAARCSACRLWLPALPVRRNYERFGVPLDIIIVTNDRLYHLAGSDLNECGLWASRRWNR